MMPYAQGQQDANVVFGFTKVAIPFRAGPGLLQKAKKLVGKWMPTWEGTKRTMIGEPGRFVDELVNRKALSKGSLIREGFKAPGMLNKALFYGLPALDVVSTLRSDSPDKPGDIASILGGSAAGMAAFRPFGMLGSMAAGMGGAALARGIVSKGRQLAGGQPPVEENTTSPAEYNPYAQQSYLNPMMQAPRTMMRSYPG